MNNASQNAAEPHFTDEQLKAMADGILAGATIGTVCNMQQEQLEAGYALAYNLYSAGNYSDAEVLFQALCLYDHNDERFWMGLAGCRQAGGNLMGAIDAYSMAGVAGALADPAPFVHAGMCYMKLGERENAKGAFAGVAVIGDPQNPQHAVWHRKAEAMLELLAGEGA